MKDVIIIGAGPAGLTAAIYTARANLDTLVITGSIPGGQAALTATVQNYPGFPESVGGGELTQLMQRQAERFGAKFIFDEVMEVDFARHPFWIKAQSEEHLAKAVIAATGVSPRKLGVPGEMELAGRGVSYCATCDGFFFKDKRVVVVGGGDSALEEALFLTKFASQVQVVHRRERLRAQPVLQERALRNPKMSFVWDSAVMRILGDDQVTGVAVRNVKTGEETTLAADGVFVYIGHIPNTELFRGKLKLDEQGYIVADAWQRTSVSGVFAAGDVQERDMKQIVIAAGSGARAALAADHYLAELEDRAYPPRTR